MLLAIYLGDPLRNPGGSAYDKRPWREPPGLLRGNCDLFVQSTLHRVPGQDRAFDAAGVFPDAGENGQLPQMDPGLVGRSFLGDELPEFLKQGLGLVDFLPL